MTLDAPSGYFDLSGQTAQMIHVEDGNYWQVYTTDRVVAVLARDSRGWFKHGATDGARFDDPEQLARLIARGAR